MRQMKHWQDPVNALLGAWMICSPWVLGFQGNTPAMWTFVATGMVLAALALGAIFLPQAWEEWTEALVGAWLVASPWLVGFAASAPAMQNALFAGLAVIVLSLWVLGTDDEYGGWLHRIAG